MAYFLLMPQVIQAWYRAYPRYRRRGASRLEALVATGWRLLLWMLLSPQALAVLQRQHAQWFPQCATAYPRLGDPIRYLVQSVWLLLVLPCRPRTYRWPGLSIWQRLRDGGRRKLTQYAQELVTDFESLNARHSARPSERVWLSLVAVFALALGLLSISQPFALAAQSVFVVLLWLAAMLLRQIPGRFASLMLIVLSFTVSCRYMWWRYTSTLNWDDPVSLVCGVLLLAAETYSWLVLVLGYFQSLWPLNRLPVSLPTDPAQLPSVDILVPTYNEGLEVVKPTIYAALGIDWPKDKLTIYILDDGNRAAFRAFAAELGVRYIARATHEHAKAGNINHALKQATGQFTAIFDCDHVPTRSFLQLTMGWFIQDPKMAMLQTPHHFFSPDPFERNLNRFRHTPNEGNLFYGLVQDGNDMWNATFFCGSCAVLRRTALDEIGGIAVETVTEDAHTSLRLHRRGYHSAYIRIPQAAGLATESLSSHIGQRIRWARGMAQIMRLDNPLFGKGLNWGQRLCYFNAMLHFLAGVPRLIFLTAPLAFLLLHAYIIFSPALMIMVFVLPHMFHASLTNSRLQGKYRHSFWSEIYETILAWYIARPTTVALINPHKGQFNVTAKGGLVSESYMDWTISRPYLVLAMLNLGGLLAAGYRFCLGPADEMPTVLISAFWVLYNMVVLGGSVAVAMEVRQHRQNHRVDVAMPAAIRLPDGHCYPVMLNDYSDGGVGLTLPAEFTWPEVTALHLLLSRGDQEFVFPARVARHIGSHLGLRLDGLTVQQHIDFIQCTFARADTWALWQQQLAEDKPIANMWAIARLGVRGYTVLMQVLPPPFSSIVQIVGRSLGWLGSFMPHPVKDVPAA